MLRIVVRYASPLLFAWGLAACTSSGTTPGGGSNGADGSSSSDDSGGQPSSDDSGSTMGSQDGGGSKDGAGGSDSGSSHGDAGSAHDASTDGGSAEGGDAAAGNTGSCCMTQTTPGCGDPNVELCVCQKIPSCCTTAWTDPCVLIVQEKYCQTGVRDCVCGTDADAGQWGQTTCCSSDWSSTCDSVATLKCGATQGCF